MYVHDHTEVPNYQNCDNNHMKHARWRWISNTAKHTNWSLHSSV